MQLDTGAFARYGEAIITVDSHTAGEPTRLVVGGLPSIPGDTINDKRLYVREHYDHVRLLLTREPRGHRDMFAAIATDPVSPEGDFGLIFMDARRYPFMCGHGTIGAVATFLEMGWLPVEAGVDERPVVVDTPSGVVHARAKLEYGTQGIRLESVAIQLESAFVQATDQTINVPGFGQFTTDLVCVGGYFAMVSADQVKWPLTADHAAELAELGMAIIAAGNEQLSIRHPTNDFVNTIDVTEFHQHDPAGGHRSVVVYGEAHVDRSPCGIGTSAKMALMHHRGLLAVGDSLTNMGVLGTTFVGKIVAETTVGPYRAIVPEIGGSAHITGLHRFVVTERDPFPRGFLLPAA